jgi:hypothetical protein
MTKKLFTAGITLFAFLSANAQSDKIYVDFSKKGHDIPKSMYGLFFEEINM